MHRRSFLASSAALLAVACKEREDDDDRKTTATTSTTAAAPQGKITLKLHRPMFVPYGNDIRLLTEVREAPLAWFDAGEKKMYVAAADRERVAQLLKATVSGKTWAFQTKDGEKQQGEEEDPGYRPYDPTRDPKKGDVIISEWECINLSLPGTCAKVAGKNLWVKCDAFFSSCSGVRERLCWEVFGDIGKCDAYSDKDCATPAGKVTVVGWSCLQE